MKTNFPNPSLFSDWKAWAAKVFADALVDNARQEFAQAHSQTIVSNTLTWRPGMRLLRVTGAGTVTTLAGTPDAFTSFILRAAANGVVVNNTSNVRLTPAANVTLDTDDSIQLCWDPISAYWFQVGMR